MLYCLERESPWLKLASWEASPKKTFFFYGALVLGQSLCSSGTWLLFRATCCTFLPLLSRALVRLIIPIVCHNFMLTFSAIIYHVNWPVLIHCHARMRWVTFRHVPNLNPYLGRPRLKVKFTGMIQTSNLFVELCRHFLFLCKFMIICVRAFLREGNCGTQKWTILILAFYSAHEISTFELKSLLSRTYFLDRPIFSWFKRRSFHELYWRN